MAEKLDSALKRQLDTVEPRLAQSTDAQVAILKSRLAKAEAALANTEVAGASLRSRLAVERTNQQQQALLWGEEWDQLNGQLRNAESFANELGTERIDAIREYELEAARSVALQKELDSLRFGLRGAAIERVALRQGLADAEVAARMRLGVVEGERDALRDQLTTTEFRCEGLAERDAVNQEIGSFVSRLECDRDVLQQRLSDATSNAHQEHVTLLQRLADASVTQERDLAASHADNDALQRQLGAVMSRITLLTEDLTIANSEQSALLDQLTAASVAHGSLEEQLAEAQVERGVLESLAVEWQTKCVALRREIADADELQLSADQRRVVLSNEWNAVVEEHKDLQEQHTAAVSCLEQRHFVVEQLTAAVSRLEVERETLRQHFADVVPRLEEERGAFQQQLVDAAANTSEEHSALQQHVMVIRAGQTALEHRCAEMRADAELKSEAHEQQIAEVKELSKELDRARSEADRLQSQGELRQVITALEAQLANESDTHFLALATQASELASERARVRSENAAEGARKEEFETRLENLEVAHYALQNRLSEVESESIAFMPRLTDLAARRLDEKATLVEQLSAKGRQFDVERKVLPQQPSQQQTLESSLTTELERRLSTTESSLVGVVQEQNAMQQCLAAAEARIASTVVERNSLRHQLDESEVMVQYADMESRLASFMRSSSSQPLAGHQAQVNNGESRPQGVEMVQLQAEVALQAGEIQKVHTSHNELLRRLECAEHALSAHMAARLGEEAAELHTEIASQPATEISQHGAIARTTGVGIQPVQDKKTQGANDTMRNVVYTEHKGLVVETPAGCEQRLKRSRRSQEFRTGAQARSHVAQARFRLVWKSACWAPHMSTPTGVLST